MSITTRVGGWPAAAAASTQERVRAWWSAYRAPSAMLARRWARGQRATARRAARAQRWVRWQNRAANARSMVLHVAGLGGLTAAAWTWHLTAGLAAAGVSCLVLEVLSRPAPNSRTARPTPPRRR